MTVALVLRLLPYLAAAGLAAGAVFWVQGLRIDVAQASEQAAKMESLAARAELAHVVKATAIAEELVAADLLTLRELAPKYAALERRIRDYAKKPVTRECSYVMDPFVAAADGLQRIDAGAGSLPESSGRAAHPGRPAGGPDPRRDPWAER